jgi:DNA repair exonuclease SbcCD ATPase subunit
LNKMTYEIKRHFLKSMIFVLLFLFLSVVSGLADDWSSCADDLDRLRRAARDALEAAERAESARQEFEDKRDELQNCINYPDIYDLMQDQCQSLRWEYESAKSDYESALSELESELSTVESRIRSVEWSCGVSFSKASWSTQSKPKQQNDCSVFRSFIGKLPQNTILDYCKKYMSESECKKCLEIK